MLFNIILCILSKLFILDSKWLCEFERIHCFTKLVQLSKLITISSFLLVYICFTILCQDDNETAIFSNKELVATISTK